MDRPKNPGPFSPLISTPEAGPPPKLVHVTESGAVEPVAERPARHEVAYEMACKATCDNIYTFLTRDPKDDTEETEKACAEDIGTVGQLILIRLGHRPGMASLAQAFNSAKVPGGVQAILNLKDFLATKVSTAFDGLEPEQLGHDNRRLVHVRSIKKSIGILTGGLDELDNSLAQGLLGRARVIHDRIWGGIKHLPHVVDQLEPLHDLISGPALQGVESAKDNSRLVSQTETKVRGEVAGQGPAAPAAPAAGSAAPAGQAQTGQPTTPGPTPFASTKTRG